MKQFFKCTDYRTDFRNKVKLDRQSYLMDRYTFKCECIACEKNYPLKKNLKVIDVAAFLEVTDQRSKSGYKEKKNEFNNKYFNYINLHYEKNFPCKELVEMMEKIKKYHDGK